MDRISLWSARTLASAALQVLGHERWSTSAAALSRCGVRRRCTRLLSWPTAPRLRSHHGLPGALLGADLGLSMRRSSLQGVEFDLDSVRIAEIHDVAEPAVLVHPRVSDPTGVEVPGPAVQGLEIVNSEREVVEAAA